MDIDGQHPNTPQTHSVPPIFAAQSTNALAGPSSQPQQPPPPVFLPPPPAQQPLRPYFDSTQDLLSRFQLLSAYDKYVRPFAVPIGTAGAGQPQGPAATSGGGKGKERELPPRDIASPAAAQTPGAGNDGDDEDGQGRGERKWKNNYKHLIKGIPGKHSMKKDDYLMTMMQVPPKQRIQIQPFDLRTQRDAFSVSLDGLKGWNINALVGESPQAKEDRKRRKELKKLAKAQGQTGVQLGLGTSSVLPTTPAANFAPAATPSVNTPGRNGTPRPGLVPSQSHPSQPAQRGQTPVGVGTPRSTTAAVATSMPPQTVQPTRHTPIPTPAPTPGTTVGALADVSRGIKREREDSASQVNGAGQGQAPTPGVTVVTNGWAKPPGVVNAKAGSAGVRPRKKQRVDVQGQAREIPMQQPTPHA